MAAKTRLKASAPREKSKRTNGNGTNWGNLRRTSAARIRKGIAADPDAHATDEEFWKSAKIVVPAH
jgi:hypothetical protein